MAKKLFRHTIKKGNKILPRTNKRKDDRNMTDTDIALISGDMRMKYAAKELEKAGYRPFFINDSLNDRIEKRADFLILPPAAKRILDASDELIKNIFSSLKDDGCIFCYSDTDFFSALSDRECIDYSSDEFFRCINNIASCEGALSKIIEAVPFCINGSNILLTGYGMLVKGLIPLLKSFGANIAVCARKKEALEEARSLSCRTFELCEIQTAIKTSEIIINTVPHMIFPEKPDISLTGKYFFELASKPYGFDHDKYRLYGGECTVCPALPSKYAPESSGRALGRAIVRLISERKKI